MSAIDPTSGVDAAPGAPTAPQIRVHSNGQAQVPDPTPPTGPTEEQVAAATDGSPAGRLRAKQAQLSKAHKEFGLPGWFNDQTGQHDLVLVAKAIADRKKLNAGLTSTQSIVAATHKVLERGEDGELVEIPNGWAGVAQEMGLGNITLGQVVEQTLADVDEITGEVTPNPLKVDGLAEQIISWMTGRRSVIEQILGE